METVRCAVTHQRNVLVLGQVCGVYLRNILLLADQMSDFFNKFGKKHPVYAPYTTPLYSNNGFAILGFVIEAVTNKTYAEYMQEAVFKPLGLTHTTVAVPSNSSVGFIPAGSSWWSTDIGFDNPYVRIRPHKYPTNGYLQIWGTLC